MTKINDFNQFFDFPKDYFFDIRKNNKTIFETGTTTHSTTHTLFWDDYSLLVRGKDPKNVALLVLQIIQSKTSFPKKQNDIATLYQQMCNDFCFQSAQVVLFANANFSPEIETVFKDVSQTCVSKFCCAFDGSVFCCALGKNAEDWVEFAWALHATLVECGVCCSIGISVAKNQNELLSAFKKAQKSAKIASEQNEKVLLNDDFSLFKFAYSLPIEKCPSLCGVVLQKPELLTSPLFETIREIFNNNLNHTKAARALFIHRNTLLYRVEKVKALTNLDLLNAQECATLVLMTIIAKRL